MVGLAEQQKRNGAAERPRIRRVFSHPVILILCQASSVLAIVLMGAFLPEGPAAILIDRGRSTYPATVQNLMWLVFALGVGELIVRLRDARAERSELRIGYLPEDDTTILQAPELRSLYAATRAEIGVAGRPRGRFLPRLIQRVVTQFQTNQSLDQANALLNSRS